MQISVDKKDLVNALAKASGAIEAKVTIPILSCIKIVADDALHITSTNLDIEVITKCQAEIIETGTACIPGKALEQIAKRMPDGSQISISVNNDIAEIKCGRSSFNLVCLPIDEFPEFEKRTELSMLGIAPHELTRLLDKAIFATSSDETKYYLCGVFFHPIDGKLTTVATNGHMLARIKSDLSVDFENGVIIPTALCRLIIKLSGLSQDVVNIGISENQLFAEFEDTKLRGKLIDGSYPNYERVLPKNLHDLTINKVEFSEAISRVSIVVDKSSGIKIAASDSIITVSASGGTTSQDTAEEKLDCLGDSSLDIGFNYRYISEILANIDGDKVTMHHNSDDSQPVTFQPSSADNELYVLMPMRV